MSKTDLYVLNAREGFIRQQILDCLPGELISFLIRNRKLEEALDYACEYFKYRAILDNNVEVCIVAHKAATLGWLFNFAQATIKEPRTFWIGLSREYSLWYTRKHLHDKEDSSKIAILINVDFCVEEPFYMKKAFDYQISSRLFIEGNCYLRLFHKNSKAFKILKSYKKEMTDDGMIYTCDKYTGLELAIAITKTRLFKQDKYLRLHVEDIINSYKCQRNKNPKECL